MIAEHIGIIPLRSGDALFLPQLFDRRDEVAVLGRTLVLLVLSCLGHALLQRSREFRLVPFEEQLHIANSFHVDVGSSKSSNTGTETSPDVILQAGTRVSARQIHLARWNQEVAMNQVDDAVSEIGRKVRTVVSAAIPA